MSMPGAFEEVKTPVSPSLPFYQADVRSFVECAAGWRLQDEGAVEVENPRYVVCLLFHLWYRLEKVLM